MHRVTYLDLPDIISIGERLCNLPALRQVGFQANRRLLEVQKVSHDCVLAEAAFQRVNRPLRVNQQRASALPFADPQVQALWSALVSFCFLPAGSAIATCASNGLPSSAKTRIN